MSLHTDQTYAKRIMTSHEIRDRDQAAKMLIILLISKIIFVLVFKYYILLVM